ncbi:hypothetical protein Tco_0360104 [Tanacetum coccineum]
MYRSQNLEGIKGIGIILNPNNPRSDFVVKPLWNNSKRVNHHYSTRITHPNPKRNFVPKAVLMKTGMRPVNAAKPKAAYNAVKRNRWMHKLRGRQSASKEKEESRESAAIARKDQEDDVLEDISQQKMKSNRRLKLMMIEEINAD